MNKSKFKKLKQVLIGIYTATFMINKFKVLLLDAILDLDCCSENVCYSSTLQSIKNPVFCSKNNCEKVFRMSDHSENKLFMNFGHQGILSFVFFHKDKLNNSKIYVFSILHDFRILSNRSNKKAQNRNYI